MKNPFKRWLKRGDTTTPLPSPPLESQGVERKDKPSPPPEKRREVSLQDRLNNPNISEGERKQIRELLEKRRLNNSPRRKQP